MQAIRIGSSCRVRLIPLSRKTTDWYSGNVPKEVVDPYGVQADYKSTLIEVQVDVTGRIFFWWRWLCLGWKMRFLSLQQTSHISTVTTPTLHPPRTNVLSNKGRIICIWEATLCSPSEMAKDACGWSGYIGNQKGLVPGLEISHHRPILYLYAMPCSRIN